MPWHSLVDHISPGQGTHNTHDARIFKNGITTTYRAYALERAHENEHACHAIDHPIAGQSARCFAVPKPAPERFFRERVLAATPQWITKAGYDNKVDT